MCYSNGRAGVIGDDEQLELPSFFKLGEKLAVCGEYTSGQVLIRPLNGIVIETVECSEEPARRGARAVWRSLSGVVSYETSCWSRACTSSSALTSEPSRRKRTAVVFM